jgi:hypothetical protein
MKRLFLLLCVIFSCFGLSAKEGIFTSDEYTLHVNYNDRVYPGDVIIINLDIELLQKSNDCWAEVSFFTNSSKTVLISTPFFQTEKEGSLIAIIPLSSWYEPGDFHVEIRYIIGDKTPMVFNLPIEMLEKNFISETIPLNPTNTAIKTDNSITRVKQIDKLNQILNTWNSDSIWQKKAFTSPTTATRRTSFFADRRVYAYSNGSSSTSLHYGIDYGVPKGTPVYACGSGKVVLVENRISSGNSIVIEHLPGLYSLYYHLDSISVTEGQMVEQGEEIGLSGDTGLATGPHLHWEIRLLGLAVNPDFLTEEWPYF